MKLGIQLQFMQFYAVNNSDPNVGIQKWYTFIAVVVMEHPLLLMVNTVYPEKYAHGFVVLCFVVFMQSFIMNSHEVFIHIHQGCFAGTGIIVRMPQCQWSKPDGYVKISQCITTKKHSKAKTVCIFLGIYCNTRLICRCNSAMYTLHDTLLKKHNRTQ